MGVGVEEEARGRVNAVEMRSVRKISTSWFCDRVRNTVIRERCSSNENVVTKIGKSILRWFGHMWRMNESEVVREIYRASIGGNLRREWPRRPFSNQIKNVLKRLKCVASRTRGLV